MLLNSFEEAWSAHKQSPEYAQAFEIAQFKGAGHERLSKKIYKLKRQNEEMRALDEELQGKEWTPWLAPKIWTLLQEYRGGVLGVRLWGLKA